MEYIYFEKQHSEAHAISIFDTSIISLHTLCIILFNFFLIEDVNRAKQTSRNMYGSFNILEPGLNPLYERKTGDDAAS